MGTLHKYMFRMEEEGHSLFVKSHEWDEDASLGSPSARGGTAETWADAGVEIVDERDRRQGKAPTNDSTDRKAADATGSSTGDAAMEKEAVKRRLSELHRLLNSRKGSLDATYTKNTEANDEAYTSTKKSIQALDAPAKEYVDFEVTMATVTHEQEAGEAEELERTLKEQGRLQDDLDNSSDALTTATKTSLIVGLHMKPRASSFATPSKFATAVQLMKNCAWTQRRRCNTHSK